MISIGIFITATKKCQLPRSHQEIANHKGISIKYLKGKRHKEFEMLNQQILTDQNATPRSIRAYTIRYRLGKNIMSLLLTEGSEEFNEWYDDERSTKSLFAADVLNKMKDPQYKSNGTVYETQKLTDKVNNVLEMVVPY